MKRIFLIVCTLACLLLHLAPRSQAEIVDRIVATVNGQIILLSDWEDALRYEAFSNMRSLDGLSPADRKSVLDRLIDQELLREQLRAGDAEPASQEDVEKRVAEIRKQYPEAETELGWRALLDRYRLTEESIRNRVGVELELMRLVDARLRPSVSVDSKSIESYYNQELLPQLRQSGERNVPLAQVTAKIKELLTQKKINQLLTAWLHDLRAGSEIRAEGQAVQLEGRD